MFENFRVFETEFAGRPLKIETGKMAQLANGECLVRYGETTIHVAATLPQSRVTASTFSRFPLTSRKSSTPSARSRALS